MLMVNRCAFGNFEQHATIPPRYFLVTYDINGKEYMR